MSFNFTVKEFILGNGTGTPTLQFYKRGFNLSGNGTSPSWQDIILSGNTALTLTNALANSLNYVRLFGGTEQLPETYLDTVTLSGGCEQRNLPSGYTQVAYLESSGTQYIDTGYKPNANTAISMKYYPAVSSTFMCLYGTQDTVSANRFYGLISSTQFRVQINSNAGQTPNFWGINTDGTLSVDTNGTFAQTQGIVTLWVDNKNKVISVKSNEYTGDISASGTVLGDNLNCAYSLLLLTRGTAGVAGNNFKGRLYSFTIKDNNVLVQNLIPARRNSDSVLGMYDTVSGNFITNAGTGTFTAGADVTVPSPDTPMDIVCNNGAIKVNLNLYSTEYHDSTLSQINGVTVITNAGTRGVNVSSMIDCRTIKSFMVTAENTTGSYRLYKYNSSKSFIDANMTGNIGDVLTLDSTVGYFRIQYNYASINTQNILIYNSAYSLNGIYTDGTQEVVTDNVSNTASAERLLAVGTYKDTQEVISGSVTRRIGIKVLDGTEEWTKGTNTSSYGNYYVGGDTNLDSNAENELICNQFGIGTRNIPEIGKICIRSTRNGFLITPNDQTINTVDKFKQFLATQYANGTPVIVVYPISTATTESVQGQLLSKSPVTQTAGSISNLPIAITESQKTVPTPQQPLQINCNNGVVKLSPNLFDKDALTLGYIDDSGNIQTSTVSAYSSAMPVVPNTTYVLSGLSFYYGTAYLRIHSYNNQDVWTSLLEKTNIESEIINPIIITTGDTDYYVRFSYIKDNMLNAQFRRNGIYADGTVETINVHGKNLFDKNDIAYTNSTILADGSIISAENISVLGYIPVQPNTTYTYSSTTNSARAYNKRMVCFDANKNYIASIADTTGNPSGPFSITGTTPANTKYVRVACSNDQVATAQLEQGSTVTTYEPYFNGGSATAENLFKIGTYQDVQSVIDGSVTRKVGIKVLDGTENWVSLSGYMSISKTNLGTNSTVLPSNSTNIFCTHFQVKTGTFVDGVGAGSSYVNFKYDSVFTTLAQWTQYLADQYANGTPVIVVYPISSPTTETVTGQPLTTQAGTNIVEITQGSIDNLPLEVSYKATV